jgi:NACalpha-BTF3-like transcription factor
MERIDEKVKKTELTLEDVETAIAVLRVFLNRMAEAESLLMKLAQYRRTYPTSMRTSYGMEDIIQMALEMEKRKEAEKKEETKPEQVSDEDIAKYKEVLRRVRGDNNIK